MPGTVDFQIRSKIIFINVHFKNLQILYVQIMHICSPVTSVRWF